MCLKIGPLRRQLRLNEHIKMGPSSYMTGVLMNKERITREGPIQRKDHVRTQQEGGCLCTKDRGISRNQSCQDLDLRLAACRTVRKLIPVFQATQTAVFCNGSTSRLTYPVVFLLMGRLRLLKSNKWFYS